jgi:broad specificity phosphatase PhoE
MFSSCKEEPQVQDTFAQDTTTTSTFFLIRHAEKDRTNPQDPDPELNQRGLGRAMHWAEIFNDIRLDAIYSTDYNRTSMTAAPAAVKQDLTTQYYDPGTLDIESFKMDNAGNNVLVVGHSNTIPQLVNQLIGEARFSDLEDDDNGSLFIVTLTGSQSSVHRLHFSCNCPE